MNESKSTTRSIKNITIMGIIVNIFLSMAKFVIGTLCNSQAVVADAVHSISDMSSDIVILFTVNYWLSPPDEKHPYGHLKIESFVTIFIGILLLSASFGIGYHAIKTIRDVDKEPLKLMAIIGPILSIVLKEILFHWTYKVGLKTNSPSVKANAWHHRSDALSSFPVLLAVVATYINPKFAFLDHVGAIIVSAFIVKIAFNIIFKSISELIDTGISKDKLDEINSIIRKTKGVEGVHKIRTRKIASSIYLDLHLEVEGNLTVYKGHDLTEKVKQLLMEKNPRLIDVLIHLEPKLENKQKKQKK
ncbi:MAG: cation diffusion facilitator family transporter [Chitinispirillia bacterium]|jgi:cation diffusion facilitator family transporter